MILKILKPLIGIHVEGMGDIPFGMTLDFGTEENVQIYGVDPGKVTGRELIKILKKENGAESQRSRI